MDTWAARIRSARNARGWSLTDAAAQLDSAADLQSRRRLWRRWEAGTVVPGPHYAAQLRELLDLPGTLDYVDRRQFFATAGALVGSAAVAGAGVRLDRTAAAHSLTGLRQALGGIRNLELSAGPAAAISPAQALAAACDQIAAAAPAFTRAVAVELLAELRIYVGHLNTLIGSWTTAAVWLERATAAAVESGRAGPLAHALGKQAKLSLRRAQFGRASDLAAGSAASGAGPHSAASYTMLHAEALAHAGDRAGARRLLAEAGRHAEHLGELEPTMPWSRAEYYPAATAAVLHTLGDPAAPRLMREAISGWPDRWADAAWTARHRAIAGHSVGHIPPGA